MLPLRQIISFAPIGKLATTILAAPRLFEPSGKAAIFRSPSRDPFIRRPAPIRAILETVPIERRAGSFLG